MRGLALAIAFVLAGCLAIPAEGDDAANTPCGAVTQFSGSSFPPGGMEIGIREVRFADLNNDGHTDMILTNAEVSNQDDYGVFVLLGPQDSPQSLLYHSFVATNVRPLGIATRDVLGAEGGCLDLAVWGENKAGSAGILEVYPWDGSEDLFDAAAPVSRASLFDPEASGPVLVAFGDFSGAGHGNDVAVADLFELRVITPGSDFANGLPTATATDVGSDGTPGGWSAINGIYARPSMRSGVDADDLVVVENQGMSWMFNDGSGDFSATTPVTASSSGMWNSKSVSVTDLDGTPPLDFIGAGGNSFGAYLIAQSGQTVTITPRPWGRIFNEVFNEIYGVAVADLGSTSAPELVAVDEGNGSADRGRAYLVDTIFDATTQLDPATYDVYELASTGLNFRHAAIADFNDDGAVEIYVLTLDGQTRCLRRKQSIGELEPCP
jgi:hypothetical protein